MAPLSPPLVKGASGTDLPAYLSNGIVGLRVPPNPLGGGMALVCGFSGLHPTRKIEAAANVPYPLALDIAVNGTWLSDDPGHLRVISQAYDFECGEVTSELLWRIGDLALAISLLTFACRHQPSLIAQELQIYVSASCQLGVRAHLDNRNVAGQLVSRTLGIPQEPHSDVDGSICWESEGRLSRCGLALATIAPKQAEKEAPCDAARSPLETRYTLKARANAKYSFQQIVSLVPSVMHSQPDRQAERLVGLGAHYGFTALRSANSAEWKELWKGRILLHGASKHWQMLADAALFYLNSSVHAGSPASTSIFGLATWHDYHYYYGHVMWDIETFTVPPLLLSQPDAAKALLGYRSRCLEGARSNAKLFGRDGIQFPWESAPATGFEAAPSPGTAAWHEDHVSLDVALAFLQYADATGDQNFLCDEAWPVLQGVADWLISRAHKSKRGWEIRRSMGIAERRAECDNEAFTALSARQLLHGAVRVAGQLGRQPRKAWSEMAENLVLPYRDGILVSHDDYRINEEKGATPSPLMGLFPLDGQLSPDVERKTREYFLRQSKGYIGSPMLSALYGVWAARGNDRTAALRFLEEGYGKFISGRFCQTLEYNPEKFPEQPQAGPFFANLGGFLMSLLYGFPGLRIGPSAPTEWSYRDVVLPEGWKEIEVERVWVRDGAKRLVAKHGRRAKLVS